MRHDGDDGPAGAGAMGLRQAGMCRRVGLGREGGALRCQQMLGRVNNDPCVRTRI